MLRLLAFLCFVAAAVFFFVLVFWGPTGSTPLLADGLFCQALGFVLSFVPVFLTDRVPEVTGR